MTARDRGVVLVNVLVILALAAAVVVLMLGTREAALARVAGLAEATAADWLALGAETSVIDALRRDMDVAPEADHMAEAWTGALQEETVLATGRFSVAISDVQAKYDLSRLAGPGLAPVTVMERLLTALDQPPEAARQIAGILRRTGPLPRLEALAAFGVPEPVLTALAPHVTVLPVPGEVNLNTVDPLLLEAMLGNRGLAQRLVAIRAREGEITREALRDIGAIRPDGSGFTSQIFDLTVRAETGRAAVALATRILRVDDLGRKSVVVLSRRVRPIQPPPSE